MLGRGEEGHLKCPMRTNPPDHAILRLPACGWAGLLCGARLVASIAFLASHCVPQGFGVIPPHGLGETVALGTVQMVQNLRNQSLQLSVHNGGKAARIF